MNGIEKAAAVLSLLGDEMSQRILGFLPEDSALAVISASEKLKTPTRETLLDVVSEFNAYMLNPPRLVEEPVREENAETAQSPNDAFFPPAIALSPLETITKADPKNIAEALKTERPEISAFVLSHLPVEKIYEVLTMLGSMKEQVESRLISIKDVPISKDLEEKVLTSISKRLS
jgi:flagellar motor switch protein FliG